MNIIGIISAIFAVLIVGLGGIVHYFDQMKIGDEKPQSSRDTFLLLGILTAICILLAWVEFMHDATTKTTAAENQELRMDQERIQNQLNQIQAKTNRLLRESTWVITPSGLIEYEEYLVK